ncbi:MAG: 50S ribosomal protein L29 [Ghiorsea sp.]|nr:50S ribosomal protein L29 [Ghiorsea sp.]MDQ6977699.1 50S ribosomal protein L29 [Ghiorsea sp.]MDQ6979990.1 50S ribosomal protein L29 [Ghiorsea sp.]MDQ7058060.1 50S ribosomal protein L29 [Ghiorsea sp.]
MKAKELRELKDAELKEKMDELAAEGMKLRFQKATMQLNATSKITSNRREVARIQTILAERR